MSYDDPPTGRWSARTVLTAIVGIELVAVLAVVGFAIYRHTTTERPDFVDDLRESSAVPGDLEPFDEAGGNVDGLPLDTAPAPQTLDEALRPACNGTGVPTAAERPADGSPRRPWYLPPSFIQSAPTPADRIGAYDTVACIDLTATSPIECNVGHLYRSFAIEARVVAVDARTAAELGRTSITIDALPCSEANSGEAVYPPFLEPIEAAVAPFLVD